MNLENSVAVVTGANRGLGRHFAAQLLDRGAGKVYAAARDPQSVDLPGVVPIRLDITDPDLVAQVAEQASDATLLINNAGIATGANLLDGDLEQIRLEMETHYFGTLAMTRALVAVIEANGGGAILNVLSVLSWLHVPAFGPYGAAKAAGWAMTGALREDLAPRGIAITSLHVGYMDTDMAAQVPPEMKVDAAGVAEQALDAIERGEAEVLADEVTRGVKQGLAA